MKVHSTILSVDISFWQLVPKKRLLLTESCCHVVWLLLFKGIDLKQLQHRFSHTFLMHLIGENSSPQAVISAKGEIRDLRWINTTTSGYTNPVQPQDARGNISSHIEAVSPPIVPLWETLPGGRSNFFLTSVLPKDQYQVRLTGC